MTIVYLDCQAGISGDMTVAALLDLGVPLEHLRAELAKLALSPESYTLSTHPTERRHVAALKFDVEVHDQHTHRHYAGIDAMIADSALSRSGQREGPPYLPCPGGGRSHGARRTGRGGSFPRGGGH